MRKHNCYTRGESLFKADSPARALRRYGNPVRRAPDAQAAQSLTRGPRPTSHTPGVMVSKCKKGKPPCRSEPPRTITRRFGAVAERYFLTKAVATRHPTRGPMKPLDVGRGTVCRRGRYGRMTVSASVDALKHRTNQRSSHVEVKFKLWPHQQACILP
jgi:hypothetical protein